MNLLLWTQPRHNVWLSEPGEYSINLRGGAYFVTLNGVGVGNRDSLKSAMQEAEEDYAAILEARDAA